jgi:hypothetical protein
MPPRGGVNPPLRVYHIVRASISTAFRIYGDVLQIYSAPHPPLRGLPSPKGERAGFFIEFTGGDASCA